MWNALRVDSLVIVLAAHACAAELVAPRAVERDGSFTVVYRTNPLATGKGTLTLKWTDVHGRLVEDRTVPVDLNDENEIALTLDARRAAAIKNELTAHLSFEGMDKKGRPDRREEDARATFIASPPDRAWRDYVILMWEPYNAEGFAKLKPLGINAGQFNGKNRTPPEFLLANDLRWYAENIATDFYSEYHRWFPDRPNHWRYLQAKELFLKDRTSKEAFKRNPSLSDPAWLARVRDRLVESARYHAPYNPVFYSLGDEAGTADLAAFWDFDFSDHSLNAMRAWLKERYGTLAALNRQWGTGFDAWERVTPPTTDEAMRRGDDNFSSWADFKEWMDVAFARALAMGNDAIRSVDPRAWVGIGGAQMPGWGGYDYWRISQALTALEPYNIGNNVEILRSLNPGMAVVTTSFARGPQEKHRVWYELLHGARGQLIWDDKKEMVADRGREVEPYYSELRGGLATLLMNSRRLVDPIAIHYSQASLRTEWMLAQKPKGEAWVKRNSSTERLDSDFLRLRESWCRLMEDLGLQYNFVAYEQVEAGELIRGAYKYLILPRSTALSDGEARAIRDFAARGGVVIADGEPGVYDEHSRRLEQPRLAGVSMTRLNALNYHQQRLTGKEQETYRAAARVFPPAPYGTAEVGVETHRFRYGGVTIVALHLNPQMRVNELGPPEFKSNERFEKPRRVTIVLPAERHAWNLRTREPLGRRKAIEVALDPFEPTLIAFSPEPPPGPAISAPALQVRGETATLGFAPAAHWLHVEVLGPEGVVRPHYSGNTLAREGMRLTLALNDPPGRWQVRVFDPLTGHKQNATFEVR